MDKDNKKTLTLSIIGILVLVIVIGVGISFAMFSFSGTGSKQNVIETGTVSMSFDPDNHFAVTNQYPMSDAKGIAQTDNKATFGVTANWGASTMSIGYDLYITNIEAGDTLTAEYIKVALIGGSNNVVVGTKDPVTNALTGGVTVASLATTAGPNGLVNSYGLGGGTLTTSGQTDNYTILAYVADTYDLPDDLANTQANVKKTSASETFSFKVGVSAAQN